MFINFLWAGWALISALLLANLLNEIFIYYWYDYLWFVPLMLFLIMVSLLLLTVSIIDLIEVVRQ